MPFDFATYQQLLAAKTNQVTCPGCGKKATFHGGPLEKCKHCGASLQQASVNMAFPIFNPSSHPRGAAGTASGGKFVATGQSGSQVQTVQRKIGGLKVDGQFGAKTKAAIEAYQKSHGLQVDGIVGSQTAAALLGGPKMAPGALTTQQAARLAGGKTTKTSSKATGATTRSSTTKPKPGTPVGSTNVASSIKKLSAGRSFDPAEYRLQLSAARQALRVESMNLDFSNITFDPAKHPRLLGKFTFASGTKSLPGFNNSVEPKGAEHPRFREMSVRADTANPGKLRVVGIGRGGSGASDLGSGLTHGQAATVLLQNHPTAILGKSPSYKYKGHTGTPEEEAVAPSSNTRNLHSLAHHEHSAVLQAVHEEISASKENLNDEESPEERHYLESLQGAVANPRNLTDSQHAAVHNAIDTEHEAVTDNIKEGLSEPGGEDERYGKGLASAKEKLREVGGPVTSTFPSESQGPAKTAAYLTPTEATADMVSTPSSGLKPDSKLWNQPALKKLTTSGRIKHAERMMKTASTVKDRERWRRELARLRP